MIMTDSTKTKSSSQPSTHHDRIRNVWLSSYFVMWGAVLLLIGLSTESSVVLCTPLHQTQQHHNQQEMRDFSSGGVGDSDGGANANANSANQEGTDESYDTYLLLQPGAPFPNQEQQLISPPLFKDNNQMLYFEQQQGHQNWPLENVQQRERRNSGHSLSIVNPLDVLRQRLLLEIGRRRLHSQSKQINANTEYLKTIGKRARH